MGFPIETPAPLKVGRENFRSLTAAAGGAGATGVGGVVDDDSDDDDVGDDCE